MGPLRNMRRKTSSRFPIPVKVGLKEATDSVASFALSFVQIGKQEEVFRLEISHKVPYQLSSSIIMIGYEQESTLMALN